MTPFMRVSMSWYNAESFSNPSFRGVVTYLCFGGLASGKRNYKKFMFVNAIEESAKNRPVLTPVNVEFIETEDELREFMRFREQKAREKLNASNE